jgi:hypothetical protein
MITLTATILTTSVLQQSLYAKKGTGIPVPVTSSENVYLFDITNKLNRLIIYSCYHCSTHRM